MDGKRGGARCRDRGGRVDGPARRAATMRDYRGGAPVRDGGERRIQGLAGGTSGPRHETWTVARPGNRRGDGGGADAERWLRDWRQACGAGTFGKDDEGAIVDEGGERDHARLA
jgi:hypothetical protein